MARDPIARPSMLALSLCVGAMLAIACDGPQSALSPAGRDAARIAELFWWMAGGAAVIWLAVMAIAIYAMAVPRRHPHHVGRLFILGGGAVLPTIVLAALLTYGLSLMPALLAPGATDGERIEVVGEQWWWRVRYALPDGAEIDLANELHLAVDRRVSLSLTAADVIHSLWVPSLAGKVDMIPGHVNRMALEPTRTGTYRGACAEFCGGSHAWMSLHVVVGTEEAHAAWLAAQRAPARAAEGAIAQRGETLFATLGCGACHTVRGTAADGAVGPDLTHVGGRRSLGAGALDNDVDGFARWLAHTDEVKPGVHMPSFEMLPPGDLRALATYLEGLR